MEDSMICDFRILRQLRKSRSLSIAELAERSGISASVISKLERNQTRAELNTLYRLAKVFRISLADMIALAENRVSHCTDEEKYRSGNFVFSRVTYGNIRCMHGFAPPSSTLSKPSLHEDDFELCWVLKGKLKVHLPSETTLLSPGMCIQFDALMPHTYEVLEECEVFIVHLKKDKRF
jgi:transcriptional regulator with XRE-family HTH domain